jgi:hypothetical protein
MQRKSYSIPWGMEPLYLNSGRHNDEARDSYAERLTVLCLRCPRRSRRTFHHLEPAMPDAALELAGNAGDLALRALVRPLRGDLKYHAASERVTATFDDPGIPASYAS